MMMVMMTLVLTQTWSVRSVAEYIRDVRSFSSLIVDSQADSRH